MINLKSFVEAIHNAIISANNTLMDENENLIDKYFLESSPGKKTVNKKRGVMVPKTVTIEYPFLEADGKITKTEILVPLITLVPITTTQIEKATISINFELDVVEDELHLNFSKTEKNAPEVQSKGTVEIIISPQQTSEGLKLLVEGYERVLKRQIP